MFSYNAFINDIIQAHKLSFTDSSWIKTRGILANILTGQAPEIRFPAREQSFILPLHPNTFWAHPAFYVVFGNLVVITPMTKRPKRESGH
jgi:hypothetical protein